MKKKEEDKFDKFRIQYAPEDFDVICEVCGTKWDFIEDKYQCPNCGDTLNKIEVATLKEEAYKRRRLEELKQEAILEEKLQKKTRNMRVIKIIVFVAVAIILFVYGKSHFSEIKKVYDTIISILTK